MDENKMLWEAMLAVAPHMLSKLTDEDTYIDGAEDCSSFALCLLREWKAHVTPTITPRTLAQEEQVQHGYVGASANR